MPESADHQQGFQLEDGRWLVGKPSDILSDTERQTLADKIAHGHQTFKALSEYVAIPSRSVDHADIAFHSSVEELWNRIYFLEQMLEEDIQDRRERHVEWMALYGTVVVFSMNVMSLSAQGDSLKEAKSL